MEAQKWMDTITYKNGKHGLVNQLMMYTEVNRYVIKHYNVTEWESEEHKQQSFGIVEKKTITTRRTITVQAIRRNISYQSETGSYKLNTHLADLSQQE